MSDRLDGSTQKRKVQAEDEDEEDEERQKRGQRGGGGNAVRSHIGSDTSNPEAATPQILPSCWTSCSLHNRIRMNRPSPAFSFSSRRLLSSSVLLPPCLYSTRASRPSSISLSSVFYLDTLLAPFFSPFFSLSFLFSRSFSSRLPAPSFPSSSGSSSRATDASRFFLPVVAETFRHRPRTKPPRVSFKTMIPFSSSPLRLSSVVSPFHRPSLNPAGANSAAGRRFYLPFTSPPLCQPLVLSSLFSVVQVA